MGAWRYLAEYLVELDLEIEDRESWATRRDDVARLQELEDLRDQLRVAIARHYIPRALRTRLHEHEHGEGLSPLTSDPRD